MSAYYNEFDPKTAAWLRELIKRGLIADGEVDERSIVEVRADDLRGFTQCHFFAGIGGWSYALRLAGWSDARPVWTGSPPCQPFSNAGKREGAADERHLWPGYFSLIRECRPAAVFGEQVAAAIGNGWLDAVFADMEAEGYACAATVLPACSVGAPHIRQRLWFVADRERGRRESRHEPERTAGPPWEDGATNLLADRQERRHSKRRCWQVENSASRQVEEGDQSPFSLSGCGATSLLADSRSAERQRRQSEFGSTIENAQERREETTHHQRGRATRVVADSAGPGLERPAGSRVQRRGDGLAGGGDGSMADDRSPRLEGRAQQPAREEREAAERGGDAVEPGREARIVESIGTEARSVEFAAASAWSDCDWIPCLDGKARPTEPGISPLDYGIPARVVRLRGYGNAIVPQVAAEVIGAFMEITAQALN